MRAGLLAVVGAAVSLMGVAPAFAGNAYGTGVFPSYIPFAGAGISTEGVAVDKVGNVYVSIAAPSAAFGAMTDQILKFSPSGAPSVLADFGPPAGGRGGLTVDPQGNVYMARNQSGHRGVFRVDRKGAITLVPGTENMAFPNAVAFDQRGNLYVTETSTGAAPNFGPGGIWRFAKGASMAEPWLRHELLTGLRPTLFPFPIGANGIAFFKGDLYVANTDRAAIIQVPLMPDGSPGEPSVWAVVKDQPEFPLYNTKMPLLIDGVGFDVHGNAYVTIISRAAVVRIDARTFEQMTMAFANPITGQMTAPIDAPTNVAFGTGKGERQSLFIINQGVSARIVPGLPWPGPGLVKIDAGVPGAPLP